MELEDGGVVHYGDVVLAFGEGRGYFLPEVGFHVGERVTSNRLKQMLT